MPDLTSDRLRLFAFTQAEHRERYLALLRGFDQAREQYSLQVPPSFFVGRADLDTAEGAMAALDQLVVWGLVDRLQDDQQVRTIAEYRQRRSVYQMTELGLVTWHAVQLVLAAQPGEAELKRLTLPLVLDQLEQLQSALDRHDGEKADLLLGQVHTTLSDLAHHAARFTAATSELSTAWEAEPVSFLLHKDRLISHLTSFLSALSSHRPTLSRAVEQLDLRRHVLIDLVAAASTSLRDPAQIRSATTSHWDGVVAWFVDRPHKPSRAAHLESRTTRAVRDLTKLLNRVMESTSGGVSHATQLEALAARFLACPDDDTAHALAGATSGLAQACHFGAVEADPDATSPSTSWWDAPPSPIDTTLRKLGRGSGSPPPRPLPDRSKERSLLRTKQLQQRSADQEAAERLVHALQLSRPLDDTELAVLKRLLSRALHTRQAQSTQAHTVRGRLRLLVVPSNVATAVPTERGQLVVEGHRVLITSSEASA